MRTNSYPKPPNPPNLPHPCATIAVPRQGASGSGPHERERRVVQGERELRGAGGNPASVAGSGDQMLPQRYQSPDANSLTNTPS